MRRKWRKAIAAMTVLVMGTGALAGCGNSTSESTASKSTSENTNQAKEETTKAASSDGAVTLTFPSIWVGTDSKAEVFGKMIEGFNKENAGKFKVAVEEQTDYDAYRDKIRTVISTGNAPDLFTVDNMADVALFSKSGKLMDLTKYLSEKSDTYQEGTVEAAQIDNLNYALPYEMAVLPVMYNGKLLEEAGVEAPKSYDELWAACEKLKANGISPICQMTNDNAWTTMIWYSYALASCGGKDVYANGLDNPAFVEAAEVLKKMFDYTSSDAIGADATVVNGHFFNERAAMYTNGTWILGRVKKEGVEGLYDNLVVTPGLSYNEKNGGAYVNAINAYFCAGKQDDPKKQEAVEAFFTYITDADRVLELANSSGASFAVAIDSAKITDPLQAEISKQVQEAEFMIPHFQAAMPTTVVTAFPAAVEGLALGDITPEEFVEELKAAQ